MQHGDIVGGQALWTVKNLPLFTLGGFTSITTSVDIFGADSGRFVQGIVDLSGDGYRGGDIVTWQFTAPPYDIAHFEHDTGPITLMFLALHEPVPDVGGTLMLLAVGLVVLFACRRVAASEAQRRHTNAKALVNAPQLPSARFEQRICPASLHDRLVLHRLG